VVAKVLFPRNRKIDCNRERDTTHKATVDAQESFWKKSPQLFFLAADVLFAV